MKRLSRQGLSRFIVLIVAVSSVTGGILLSNLKPSVNDQILVDVQRIKFDNLYGQTQSLADRAGSYRVVNFWATWCPPCLEEIPLFVELQKEYGAKNFTFIGVAVDDDERVRRFVIDNEVNYPMLIGSTGALQISELLGNVRSGLPFTVFLSPDGDLLGTESGVVPEQKIRDFISKIQ